MNLLSLAAEAIRQTELDLGSPTCTKNGHCWVHVGGADCGCDKDSRERCSIPVHRCSVCGEYDYGINAEANSVRSLCHALKGD